MNDEPIVSPFPSSLPSTNDVTLDLGRILQRLRVTDGTEMLIKVVMDFLRGQFERCPLIWLGLYDRRTHTISGKGGILPSDNRQALRHSFGLMSGDTLEQVVIQQRPIHIANLQREKNAGDWSRAARQAGIRSAFVLPITSRKQCLGLVVLGSDQTGLTLDMVETTQLTIILGEFANLLSLRELEEQRIRSQHPHTVLLKAVEHLQSPDPLGCRIDRVLDEIQLFIQPTQTELYWIDTDRQCFVRHPLATLLEARGMPSWIESKAPIVLPSDLKASLEDASLLMADCAGLHASLLENRPVAIGESYSSLPSLDTGKLITQLKARSVLAAPLWSRQGDRGELFGFLATTARVARMWTKEEQRFLHGVSRNIALAVSSERLAHTYHQLQVRHNATLALAQTSRIRVRHTTVDTATHPNFEAIAEQLCTHLAIKQIAILQLDPTLNAFVVVFQRSPDGAIASPLPGLSVIDYQLLERSTQAIALDDLTHRLSEVSANLNPNLNPSLNPKANRPTPNLDLRFSPWQPHFAAAGWNAIALCNIHPGKPPEFLVVIGQAQPQCWPEQTLALLDWTGQQVAAQVDRAELDRTNQQLHTALTTLARGFSELQQAETTNTAERNVLKQVSRVLDATCVVLLQLSPLPGVTEARVVLSLNSRDLEAPIATGTRIDLKTDPILQQSLLSSGFIGPLSRHDLPDATRSWLGEALQNADSQVYVVALRPEPAGKPCAIFIATNQGQRWDDRQLSPTYMLLEALIQFERNDQIMHLLHDKRHTLEPLNWHKHRQLEALYWTLGNAGRQIERLLNQLAPPVDPQGLGATSSPKDTDRERLYGQQTLRVLGESLENLKISLQQEQWQLSIASEPVSLVTLLKRVLERCDPLLKKRQLWLQVHREGNTIIQGDRHNLELIIYELLTRACQRSEIGGRLDIWYRPIMLGDHLNTPFLELAITDSGTIDQQLIQVVQQCLNNDRRYTFANLTAPELDRPPGIHLAVYYRLMTAMGGYFYLDALDDGRVATRLMIPLIDDESHTILNTSKEINSL